MSMVANPELTEQELEFERRSRIFVQTIDKLVAEAKYLRELNSELTLKIEALNE